jgi:hypothetical protein
MFWPAWVCTKLVIVPLLTRRSRQYEYEADVRAASLGDEFRLGLRRALDELSSWERPRTGWEDVIAATHPPIEHRLQLLEAETIFALATEDGSASAHADGRPLVAHPASMSLIERLRR